MKLFSREAWNIRKEIKREENKMNVVAFKDILRKDKKRFPIKEKSYKNVG
jgi:inorganic pyrophosphatase/exopolyphosphatase